MFECSRDEILGSSPLKFSPVRQPDGKPSKEKALRKIKAALDGKPQMFEWQHITLNGRKFDAEITLSRVDFSTGVHLQSIVRDITIQKRAEEKLQKKKNDFGLWCRIPMM